MRDWWDWHAAYDDESGSLLQDRLRVVQAQILRFLASRSGAPVRIVSACAGQGRDVLGALASARGVDVAARLIELDARNAAAAEEAVRAAGLDGVEVVCGDASVSDAYLGAVPADVVMMCGIFGNIADEDVQNTISHLAELCATDGIVIWTRHTYSPDLTPAIRRWFRDAGFHEEAFESPGPKTFGVGVHRLVTKTRPLQPGQRLFDFATGYLVCSDEIIARLDNIKPVGREHTCRYRTTTAFTLVDSRLRRALKNGELDLTEDGAHNASWVRALELALPNGNCLREGFAIRLDPDGTARLRY